MEALIAAHRQAVFPDHPYAWVITRDREHELRGGGRSAVGVSGPAQATEEMVVLARTRGRAFRMRDEGDLDDMARFDGVRVKAAERGVVYEGVIWTRDEPARKPTSARCVTTERRTTAVWTFSTGCTNDGSPCSGNSTVAVSI